ESDERMETLVKTQSGGLAEVKDHNDERIVQFIHESVSDFLIQKGIKKLSSSAGSATGHHRLSRSCINYIAMEEVAWPSNMTGADIIHQFPFMRYATACWPLHCRRAESEGYSQE